MHIIIMLLLLSILIIVHELGHFLTARAFGIKVDKFGFGLPIGPTLYEGKWGETKILVHAFLLGGYVAFPDDDEDSELPKDSPERFKNKPIYQKSIVVSAGVIANAVCALVLVLMVAFISGSLPSGKYNVFINKIVAPKEAPMAKSGAMPGDKIISVNNKEIDSSFKFIMFSQKSKMFDGYASEEKIAKQIDALKRKNPNIEENTPIKEGTTILLPPMTKEAPLTFNDNILKGMEKYTPAGVKLSDSQVKLRDKIEGQTTYKSDGTTTIKDIAIATSDTYHPMNIIVERNGSEIKLKEVFPNKKGMVGIELDRQEILVQTSGFLSGLKNSWTFLYDNTYLMIYGLVQIFSGKIPVEDLHGIVAITKVGGDIIAHKGIWSGILLTALISMDLAIVNLLPIPALDGGHLIFLAIEKLRGKPVDEETLEKISQIGFMFLIALMFLIIFNDVFALVTHKL